MDERCVFCVKIEERDYWGRDPEVDVVWFEPLNPVTPGHMLFVPMEHVRHNYRIASVLVGEAFEAASRFAQLDGIHRDYNLITSSGPSATQTVPHVHIHYVPRSPGDGLHLPWGLPHD